MLRERKLAEKTLAVFKTVAGRVTQRTREPLASVHCPVPSRRGSRRHYSSGTRVSTTLFVTRTITLYRALTRSCYRTTLLSGHDARPPLARRTFPRSGTVCVVIKTVRNDVGTHTYDRVHRHHFPETETRRPRRHRG